jgi:hypothetical protein
MLKLLTLFVVLAAAAALALLVAPTGREPVLWRRCLPSGRRGDERRHRLCVCRYECCKRSNHLLLAFNLPATITAAHIHETETGSVA